MDPIRKSNPQLGRLILAAALFVAWIGMLAILAATTTRPVVLSRPQFLVSDFDDGWQGPGRYILPLKKTGAEAYVVALPGPSPGFDPMKLKPRIYRETPETLHQLISILKSK